MAIKAIVFDFDGLILDTETPEFAAWREVFQAKGGHLSLETWSACIGTSENVFDPYDELEAQLGHPYDRDAVREWRHRLYQQRMEVQPLQPGVEDALRSARRLGLKIGLASSSGHAWVEGYLGHYGVLSSFDAIRCKEDVVRTKPDPALYLSAVSALNVRPDEALALEDSPNGIAAAKAAGLACVAVPNSTTASLPLDRADLRLNSLAEMPLESLIRRIEGIIRRDPAESISKEEKV